MTDLKDELQTIDGVGEATADKIVDVVADHSTPSDPLLDRAVDAAESGNSHAAVAYLKRYGRND